MQQHYDAPSRDAANHLALSPLSRLKRAKVVYAAHLAAAGLARLPETSAQAHDWHKQKT